MPRRSFIRLIGGGALALLSGCAMATSSFRYRMRVEGEWSGSAVYEVLVERTRGPRLADETPGGSIVLGEALMLPAVPAPVFVLLRPAVEGRDLKGAIMRALAPDVSLSEEPFSWAVAKHLSGLRNREAIGELPRGDWPLMVRFRDLADSTSVEKVEPEEIGVRRISVQVTDDAVSRGIEAKLVWLKSEGRTLDPASGPTFSNDPPLAQLIKQNDFKSGNWL